MTSRDTTGHNAGGPGFGRIEAGLGRARPAPGLAAKRAAVPRVKLGNFVLGECRAYSRDDGTPGWEAMEEIVGGLECGSSVSLASGMARIVAIFDQLLTGSVVALPDDCNQGVAGLAKTGQSRGRSTRASPRRRL
jgi:hypothetical protein